MLYRINEIKLKPNDNIDMIPKIILKKLGKQGKGIEIDYYRIVKESIDARDKSDIRLVYSVDFSVIPRNKKLNICMSEEKDYEYPKKGLEIMENRPIICGFGPAGMFAALILARMGYRPIVLERGSSMDKRVQDVELFWEQKILNKESNVQFGEGGAGTFSDGKLTTNIKDKRINFVLKELVMAGADSKILYRQKPHIGTDILRDIVVNIREEIKRLGGSVYFDTKLTEIIADNGKLKTVIAIERKNNACDKNKTTEKRLEFPADALILAIGHSARDTMQEIYDKGISIEQKPFSIGFRIQHPQELIDISQYGKPRDELMLPPAEYKLSHKCKNGRGVYTFCMCPGGEIVMSASEEETIVTNGMSYSKRDGKYANSAILTDVRTADFESSHPLAGLRFQEKYEKLAFQLAGGDYTPPKCNYSDFRDNSKAGGVLRNSLPSFAVEAILEAMPVFGKKIKGFDDDEALLVGVETRSSSPIRILRNDKGESSITGIYPAGEGAGYAGGIMSAAVDGIKCAERIVCKYKYKGD